MLTCDFPATLPPTAPYCTFLRSHPPSDSAGSTLADRDKRETIEVPGVLGCWAVAAMLALARLGPALPRCDAACRDTSCAVVEHACMRPGFPILFYSALVTELTLPPAPRCAALFARSPGPKTTRVRRTPSSPRSVPPRRTRPRTHFDLTSYLEPTCPKPSASASGSARHRHQIPCSSLYPAHD
jgi:hypothetical protein